MRYAFSENEMVIKGRIQDWSDYPAVPIYDTPISLREGFKAVYKKEMVWLPTIAEFQYFCPSCIPDVVARGAVMEGREYPEELYGGPDMFGIPWEYEKMVGGSMVQRGYTLFDDANDWKEKVIFPDINAWDWEKSAKLNEKYLASGRANILRFFSGGWFERLISFMGFEDAAVAIIDEEQKNAVIALFEKVKELHCKIVDKCCEYYDIDGFNVHDDWGSQKNPFFSNETAEEMIVPYMKMLTDHIHSKGMIADLHSCGSLGSQIENIVKAGWDSWAPQTMNPIEEYYKMYGDRIVLELVPPKFDWVTTSEEEQRKYAREFLDAHYDLNKTYRIGYYGTDNFTTAYMEELYRYSRIIYSRS